MSRRFTAVGVYIYAGGFTVGVRDAGFKVLAHLEDGAFGVATVRRNLPRVDVHVDPERWPLDELRRRGVDLVYANPPCAPWSASGITKNHAGELFASKYKRDPRVSCVYQTYNVLHEVRPKVWVWESVTQALSKGRELVDELTAGARELGYAATYVLFNLTQLGVPQKRYRFFCVFHRVDIPWTLRRRRTPSAWEAIKDLPPPTEADGILPRGVNKSYARTLPHTAPGEGIRVAWDRLNPPETRELNKMGHVKGRPAFGDFRMPVEGPVGTVIGGPHIFHPYEDRPISVPELRRLCGYPDGYEFVGKITHQYVQAARAVLPPAGRWLARNVKRGLERGRPAQMRTRKIDFFKNVDEVLT